MKKIETLMNEAITTSGDFNLDNTQVITISDVSFVYLYNNLIAMVGDTWMQIFDGDHQTATTKSRLNSLLQVHGNGARIFSKNFEWFLIDENGAKVKFQDGMILN